jgi:hypothetical protein
MISAKPAPIAATGRGQEGAIVGGYCSGRRGRRPGARALTVERLRFDVGMFRRTGGAPLEAGEPDAHGGTLCADGATVCTWRAVEPGQALEGGPAAPAGAIMLRSLEGDRPPVRLPIAWRRVGYGWRPWWQCPACGQLARFVYGPPIAAPSSAARWTCRTCAALAYRSTRQPDYQRAGHRARRAAAALGMPQAWTATNTSLCALSDWQPRPPGMHWRTWRRRLEAWQGARLEFDAALHAELGRGWGGSHLARLASLCGGMAPSAPLFDDLRRVALERLAAARAQRRAARAAACGAASG